MASTVHGALAANTVTTVTLRPGNQGLIVINRDMAGEIYVRVDGQDPQILGADSYVVLGARYFPLPRTVIQQQLITIKLIASVARNYSVEAVA